MLANDLAHVANLVHRQRGPGGVALGALDKHRFYLGIRHGLGQSLQVGRILRGEVHLAVFHAEVLQGPGALVCDTDDTQQGVVGSANGGDQHVSGTQAAKQGRRNGVGAIDKPDAHQGILGAKQMGIDLVQLVPAQVVIAITSGSGKIALRHSIPAEGVQHSQGVGLSHCINAGKLLFQRLLCPAGQGAQLLRKL